MAETSPEKFEPFVPADQEIPEFTVRAVVLGALFGIVFGAATVYLALRAGLTVSASVPIAVLSIAVFKRLGKSTILENNMVQTIGSAGESVAAGVVFTVPALLVLSYGANYFNYLTIFVLSAVGGILGVLFISPRQPARIIRALGTRPSPESTSRAAVLTTSARGGDLSTIGFSRV